MTNLNRRVIHLEERRGRARQVVPSGPVYDFSMLSPQEQGELDDLLALVEPLAHEERRRPLTAGERARLDELWSRGTITG